MGEKPDQKNHPKEADPSPGEDKKNIPVNASIGPGTLLETPVKRRKFFALVIIGWSVFFGAVAGFLTLMVRFMFPNVLFEPEMTFKVGYPDDYKIRQVDTRWKAKYGIWIVRNEEYIYALSTVCTHLGCTPNWLENERKFKCPCHGSGYKISGINFEGPAPRPLERFRIALAEDGQIRIDKTKKFQQEKGQWTDPESYLAV